MGQDEIHALTAAYALDALDPNEERDYEAHLPTCEHCREELRRLSEAAASLAYAVETPPPPPPDLRERILSRARAERSNVVQLRPRRAIAWAGAAAAAAAATVAVALGLWGNSMSDALDRERLVTAILADPAAERIALEGASGELVRSATGRAALVVLGLEPAPASSTYEVWVADEGGPPEPAGLFDGKGSRDVLPLELSVPEGALVMVTLEREGGSERPTGSPLFTARA